MKAGERAIDELWHWFNDCAMNLQNVAARDADKLKGAHPCECMHFADDARARVEALLRQAEAAARAEERAECAKIADRNGNAITAGQIRARD